MARLPERSVSLGLVTSFIVNYEPTKAIEYDRDGNQIRTLDRALQAIAFGLLRLAHQLSALYRE